jgi:Nuclease-related domain
MADFSHRPGWWLASDGTWHPPQQRSSRPLGLTSGRRGTALAPPGAQCEYRVSRILRQGLSDGEIFSDRRVAGAAESIDHIVVASSGVWVVDAKKRRAVSYRGAGPEGAVMRLYSGKDDITFELDNLAASLLVVGQLVRDSSVPLRSAMVVLPEQCRLMTGVRFRLGRSFEHDGILICPPRVLVEHVQQHGPVSHDQIVHIGHRLNEALAR